MDLIADHRQFAEGERFVGAKRGGLRSPGVTGRLSVPGR